MAWAEGVDRWNPREGAGRKRFRRGSEGTPPGKTGWKLRVSQHPAPPAGALPFGRSRVWEKAEPRQVQPSWEMGGPTASQKTETGGRKQVGKEGAGSNEGGPEKVGEGPRSLEAGSLGVEGAE